jgi:hypothetical protein
LKLVELFCLIHAYSDIAQNRVRSNLPAVETACGHGFMVK